MYKFRYELIAYRHYTRSIGVIRSRSFDDILNCTCRFLPDVSWFILSLDSPCVVARSAL